MIGGRRDGHVLERKECVNELCDGANGTAREPIKRLDKFGGYTGVGFVACTYGQSRKGGNARRQCCCQ